MIRRFLPSLGLAALLLVACADPPAPSESPPSEVTTSTERRPEDAGLSEETTAEPRPESLPEHKPDACQANCPRITRLEGEGTAAAPVYPSGTSAPQGAVEAKARFRETWVVEGEHLDRLTRLTLVSTEDKTKTFELSWEGQASMTKRTVRLPNTLVAGLFLLVGFVGTTPVALGQTFVLQGEGLDQETRAFLERMKKHLGKSTDTSLTAEAAEISFKTAFGKVIIESPSIEIKAGTSTLSFEGSSQTLHISGSNVQISNGSGQTERPNGLGNLVLGYQTKTGGQTRTGSHNLILGDEHEYTSVCGIVSGKRNTLTGLYAASIASVQSTVTASQAAVLGGTENRVLSFSAVILAGSKNIIGASPPSENSVVLGGIRNAIFDKGAIIAGGANNSVTKADAGVFGGNFNVASGMGAAVLGGLKNEASNDNASVLGGNGNIASGDNSSITGGISNRAIGSFSAISGGLNNETASVGGYICGSSGKKTAPNTPILCP